MESSLRELLRRLHGSSKHVGRRYEAPRPETLAEVDVRTELRDKLQRAVDAEQFELAAELRDKLRVME
jgi:protein arginine kinase activator